MDKTSLELLQALIAALNQNKGTTSQAKKAEPATWSGTEDQYRMLLTELDRAINDPDKFPRLSAAKGIHSFHSGWNNHVRGLGFDPIAFCREAERRGHIHQRPTKGGVVIYPLTESGRQYLATAAPAPAPASKKTTKK